jgi:predicted nucleic acid-binding protein
MIIVDTTVWVDYLRGTRTPHTGGVKRCLEQFPVILSAAMVSDTPLLGLNS